MTYLHTLRRTLTLIMLTGIVLLLLLQCTNRKQTESSGPRDDQTTQPHFTRQRIIQQLHLLHEQLASTDKERIADHFSFPLTEASYQIGFPIANDTFAEHYRKNGSAVSRQMFLDHFAALSAYSQFDELTRLLGLANLDSLNAADSLRYATPVDTEPCTRYYRLHVRSDEVVFVIGTDTNDRYQGGDRGHDRQDDHSGEFCESILYWHFRYDGTTLKFLKNYGAG